MIVINAAMMHDRLIEIVTSVENPKITFVSKKGMNLEFTSENEQAAADAAKKALKATAEFKTVYFQIHVQ